MDKISFKEFQQLCELNSDKKHVPACLDTIKNSDCLFHPGIIMPNKHIASLYQTRLEIARDSKRFDKDYIRDYEETVSNLKSSTSINLALATLYGQDNGFIVFYEPLERKVLGVLKADNPSGLQTMEENVNEVVAKGHSSGFEKYSKGELIKEWH